MDLRIKRLHADAVIPSYATPGDAGLDLYPYEMYILKPGEQKLFRTGIAMEIPNGYVGLIWDKSGHAAKRGIKVFGGVVDAGYRGEVMVSLKNFSESDFGVTREKSIAQMLIQPVVSANITEVGELSDTQRGEGGFGSTEKVVSPEKTKADG